MAGGTAKLQLSKSAQGLIGQVLLEDQLTKLYQLHMTKRLHNQTLASGTTPTRCTGALEERRYMEHDRFFLPVAAWHPTTYPYTQ